MPAGRTARLRRLGPLPLLAGPVLYEVGAGHERTPAGAAGLQVGPVPPDPVDLEAIRSHHPDAICVSAVTGKGLDILINRIADLHRAGINPHPIWRDGFSHCGVIHKSPGVAIGFAA